MSALLAALILAVAPGPTAPDDAWKVGFLDLFERTKPVDQPYTRYLSLHALAEPARARALQVLTYAANSTSFRSELGRPQTIADGLIVKIDLRAFAWDSASRHGRLLELERRGVKFGFKNAEERRLFLDPWERLAKLDPYFFTDPNFFKRYYPYDTEGWIDPYAEKSARDLSRSAKFMLRADWALPRLLLEKQFGGIYSDLLMFPPKEADLYKSFLIDIDAVNRDDQLRQGGAVLESIVALHNRELQLIPSPYGQAGNRFFWQTFDVNVDARGNKSVLETFAGTLEHDGRESIGSLPNGLLWYLLFDGKGNQAAVVPEDIAQVKQPVAPVRETRVINSYKCLECHGPANGIYPFDDVVRKTFLSGAAYLKGVHHRDETAALEDYYASTLGATIATQQAAYARRLQECCGMTGTEAAKAVVGAVESYIHDLVSPEAAAREMGLSPEAARVAWLRAKNPQLLALATGQPIRRAAWELSFADAMRVVAYPWETKAPVKEH